LEELGTFLEDLPLKNSIVLIQENP